MMMSEYGGALSAVLIVAVCGLISQARWALVTWQGVIKATADWGPEMEIRGRLSKKSKSRALHTQIKTLHGCRRRRNLF